MQVDGDAVAKAVIDTYASLPSNGKPKSSVDAKGGRRSEWTVLAGFCVAELDSAGVSKVTCVSLGTGLRCLPHAKLPRHGDVLHDSHAEIIARRGLKLYLIEQIRIAQSQSPAESSRSVLEKGGDEDVGRWKLKAGVRIGMYISTLPCGDASTYALSLLAPADSSSEAPTPSPSIPSTILATSLGLQTSRTPTLSSSFSPTLPPQVHRGRISYSTINTLRTKPGRLDSPPSTSHSCSDKIALWNYLGLQGGILSSLIGKIDLSLLVIGGVDGSGEEREIIRKEVDRSVKGRLEGWMTRSESRLEVFLTDLVFSGAKPVSEDVQVASCPESISYIEGLGTEIIVNGTRQSVSAKRVVGEALSVKARSRLSKLGMFTSLQSISKPSSCTLDPFLTYHLAKHSPATTWYQSVKSSLRGKEAPFEGWLVSGKEYESFGLEGRVVANE